MRPMNMKNQISKTHLLLALMVAVALLIAPAAYAPAPGITGGTTATATFNLTAQTAFLNQPDGSSVYSWGYGCDPANPPPGLRPRCPTRTAPRCRFPDRHSSSRKGKSSRSIC